MPLATSHHRLLGLVLCALIVCACAAVPARAASLAAPNDPRWNDQWALQNIGQQVTFDAPVGVPGADVSALEAWRWTQGAGAPPLAVIDSGVDFEHPDLVGAAWRNPGEIPANDVDDDDNGHVDDVTGWNFFDDSADTRDPVSHGTGVASVAAARANDGVGIAGIAPRTEIMSLRVEDDLGYGGPDPIVAALAYADAHGARVANLSLGLSYDGVVETLDAAVREVPELLVVASAGNRGLDNDDPDLAQFPCALTAPNVICVAASDARDDLAAFSSFGAQAVDLAAPGEDMLTAISADPSQNRPHTWGWGGGTSLSAPMVAGTAQLLLAARPDLTVGELRAALLDTGTPAAALAGKTVTGRRLNAAAALQSVAGPPPASESPVEPEPGPEPLEALPPRPAPVPAPAPAPASAQVPAASAPAAPAATVGPAEPAARPTSPRTTAKPAKTKTKTKKTAKRPATKNSKRRKSASRKRAGRKRKARSTPGKSRRIASPRAGAR